MLTHPRALSHSVSLSLCRVHHQQLEQCELFSYQERLALINQHTPEFLLFQMEADQIWLDKLPSDVCARIARCTKTSSYRSALNLANVSSTQRTALQHALQYTLDLLNIAHDTVDNVIEIGSNNDTGSSSNNSEGEGGSNYESGSCSHAEGDSCSHDEGENTSDEGENNSDEGENTSDEGENTSGVNDEGENSSDVNDEGGNCSDVNDERENNSDDGSKCSSDCSEQDWQHAARELQRDYAALLSDDVREMYMYGGAEKVFTEPTIQSCLTSGSLVKLCISQLQGDLRPVQHGTNIRALELVLDDCDVLALLRGFSNLQLRELRLQATGDKCLHNYFTDDPQNHSLLAELFPQVDNLALACPRCGEDEESPWFLWNVIEKFPNLKEVTLSEGVPDSAIEKLRKMDRVTLIAGFAAYLVGEIPDRIVSVSTSRLWANSFPHRVIPCEHAFEIFANCVNLQELNCVITHGAEGGLVPIVGNLRSLGLAFACVEPGEQTFGTAPLPLEPAEGVLLDVVKSAPFLKSLRLVNMRIRRCELREILIAGGKRLEKFEEEVFVDNYMEQFSSYGGTFLLEKSNNKVEMEELAKTLRTAALNNPKLKRFKLDLRAGWFSDMDAVVSTLPKVLASFDVLQRHAVGLDVRDMKELLRKFETGSIGLIDMMFSLGLNIPFVAVSQ